MITVLFSCNKCGIVKHPTQVPARDGIHVDVRDWVLQVGEVLSREHDRLSPNCKITELTEVYFPAPPEAEFLGQQNE